jgi:hypothetical protein
MIQPELVPGLLEALLDLCHLLPAIQARSAVLDRRWTPIRSPERVTWWSSEGMWLLHLASSTSEG